MQRSKDANLYFILELEVHVSKIVWLFCFLRKYCDIESIAKNTTPVYQPSFPKVKELIDNLTDGKMDHCELLQKLLFYY